MPLTPEQIEFDRRLIPAPLHWGHTGVIKPPFDARDYLAEWHPGIAAHLPMDLAPIDLLRFVKEPRYDQGAEGSCTCFATSGDCTMDHSEADGSWPQYAGHQLYAEAGGVGNSGTDPRRVLQICVDNGTPLLAGGREKVIKSYVALTPQPGVFRQQVKAALAAGEVCIIYALLPIPFGWHSGTVLSTGYHEFLGIGWMVDAQGEWCIVLNTWGDSWPGDAPPGTPRGVGRILFDALEQSNGQNGYLGGFVATSLLVTPGPPPPPPPPQLSINGYSQNPVTCGSSFAIQGTGFAVDAKATFAGTPLTLGSSSPGQLMATAPLFIAPMTYPVIVSQQGAAATGPPLTINPAQDPPPPPPARAATVTGRATAGPTNGVWPKVGDTVPFGQDVTLQVQTLVYDGTPVPPPPPPGDVTVHVITRRHGTGVSVWVYAQTPTGAYVGGSAALRSTAGTDYGTRILTSTGVPVVWTIGAPTGTVLMARLNLADGSVVTGMATT